MSPGQLVSRSTELPFEPSSSRCVAGYSTSSKFGSPVSKLSAACEVGVGNLVTWKRCTKPEFQVALAGDTVHLPPLSPVQWARACAESWNMATLARDRRHRWTPKQRVFRSGQPLNAVAAHWKLAGVISYASLIPSTQTLMMRILQYLSYTPSLPRCGIRHFHHRSLAQQSLCTLEMSEVAILATTALASPRLHD